MLNNIDIPHEAAVCRDKMYSIHKQNICAYHDAIIMVMMQACSETIPISKSGCRNVKAVPGRNEYIEFQNFTLLAVFRLTIVNLGKPMYSIIRNHITLTGLTMLRVKVKFLISL